MKLIACRIFFCFYMFLLTNNFVKNSHIESTIFLFFLKSVPNKNRNFLHTKFRRQWKHRKSSYQVREALPSFSSELLTLCSNSVKSFEFIESVEEIKFGALWDELKLKKCF